MSLEFLQRHYRTLLTLKILAALASILLPLNLPHAWRQIDTLSVGLRYWLRWTHGSDAHLLWPAVLNSGDYIGYMGMEFPVLNILIAPLFAFGPGIGKTLSLFAIFALNISLWLLAVKVWKGIKISDVEVSKALLWLPLFGSVATLYERIIPDTPAMLLCLISCGLIWKDEKRFWITAFVLATIGMLIKPPVCVTFGLLLLRPGGISSRIKMALIPAVAVAITVAYFFICVPFLDALETNGYLFATKFRNPIASFTEYFQHPRRILELIDTKLFFPGFIFGILLITSSKDGRSVLRVLTPLAGVWLLQFLAIVGLDGEHSFVHSYYYSGLAPTSALTVISLLSLLGREQSLSKIARIGSIILCVGILALQIKSAHFNMITLSILGGKPPPAERMPAFSECDELKQKASTVPWGTDLVFRTEQHTYPKLGLCFGERTGSKISTYGLYYLNETVPEDCVAIAQSTNLQVVTCNK